MKNEEKPTHEEKMDCSNMTHRSWDPCPYCAKPSPSAEARVDWELETQEIIKKFLPQFMSVNGFKELHRDIAKALSAAFEKGREAR